MLDLRQARVADEPLDRASFQEAYRVFVTRDSYDLTSLACQVDAMPLLEPVNDTDAADA